MTRAMSAFRSAAKVGVLLALLPTAGCFTYATTSLDVASPGTNARLRLDQDGFGRVANQAAMSGFPVASLDANRRGIVGRIMAVGQDALSVQMRGIGGSVFLADVPTRAVEDFAVRSFSKKRTVAAIAVGFALAGTVSAGVVGGTTGSGGPGDPDNLIGSHSIPWISIPFR